MTVSDAPSPAATATNGASNSTARPAVQVTEQIASFIVEAGSAELGPDAIRMAVRAFIDTIGVAIAGADEPVVASMTAALEPTARPHGSTVLTTGQKVSARDAAAVNATAGHALDFDDHLSDVNGHPSVVLVPAILAIAEEHSLRGIEALRTYVIGHQVMCAVSAALPVRAHWTKGWHATETVGVLGATVAAGHLLNLSMRELRNALGIAASMAAGSRQNCGYSVKPVHAGMAASNGVLAAKLAAAGVDADPSQLEAPLGFFAVFGVDSDLTAVAPVLAERWTVTTRGLNVKAFPACYAVHPAGEAAVEIAAGGIKTADIEKVVVTVQPTGLVGPIHHDPVTVNQARFSMEFAVAAGLRRAALDGSAYSDVVLADRGLRALMPRVIAMESSVPPFGDPSYEKWYAAVEVHTVDGAVHRARRNMPHGYAHDPLTDAELDAKFLHCLSTPDSPFNGPALLAGLRQLATSSDLSSLLTAHLTR